MIEEIASFPGRGPLPDQFRSSGFQSKTMSRSQTTSRSRSCRGLILGIICALLVVYSATIQVAHAHEAIGASHSGCALCLMVHAGITPDAPAQAPALAEHADRIEIPAEPAVRSSFVFSFYSRPPPAEFASI
jgi:hypothetical protein